MVMNLSKKLMIDLVTFPKMNSLPLPLWEGYTKFNSFREFILYSGLIDPNEENINEAIKAISKNKLDEYIRKNTNNKFNSWEDLLKGATDEFIKTIKI